MKLNKYKVEFIHSRPKWFKRKQWRWKVIASNGKVIGGSTESYNNYTECVDNAHTLSKVLTYSFYETYE